MKHVLPLTGKDGTYKYTREMLQLKYTSKPPGPSTIADPHLIRVNTPELPLSSSPNQDFSNYIVQGI